MEGAYESLVESGILGAIVVIQFFAIGYLFKKYVDSKTEHLEDVKGFRDSITEPLQKLQETSVNMADKMEQYNELLIKLLSKR